ncbi:hypothetical protein METUNv1_00960 [Methyloversatilis universalis FAM5]|uniref:Uncharacterized protein n=1 Tax=Methyloversatilis universalis (strain ATCC BAA-1314 / DSM 25237 / JCM 13912 / CCUG 52030 / FAM5) TaxID=1000565 RepID=F5R9N9_METUF|nr:hypothetical protein METUNv1_00960 [Methyloversatilis universalis FAM5]
MKSSPTTKFDTAPVPGRDGLFQSPRLRGSPGRWKVSPCSGRRVKNSMLMSGSVHSVDAAPHRRRTRLQHHPCHAQTRSACARPPHRLRRSAQAPARVRRGIGSATGQCSKSDSDLPAQRHSGDEDHGRALARNVLTATALPAYCTRTGTRPPSKTHSRPTPVRHRS